MDWKQVRKVFLDVGGKMLELTWTSCLQFSVAATGIATAYIAILGFVQGAFKSDVVWMFVTLFQATIVVALVILAFALLVKVFVWVAGKILIQIAVERNARQAKVVAIITDGLNIENERFVIVYNDEFWLRADDVVVETKFIFENRRIEGEIRWADEKEKNNGNRACILRKKYKVLRFATVTDTEIIIHMADRSEVFPLPHADNPHYEIPITMSASMSFLGYKVKMVNLLKNEMVIILHDGKVQIRRYT